MPKDIGILSLPLLAFLQRSFRFRLNRNLVKVPGKKCLRQVTRPEKRKDRAEKKLKKFLRVHSKPTRAQRKQYELVTGRKAPKPLTKKEREAWAEKAFAQIKGHRKGDGLGELEMIMITSLREEWFAKEKNDQKKLAWAKALPVIEKNRKEATARFLKSFGPSSYAHYRRKS
jgi:hypothetical protein